MAETRSDRRSRLSSRVAPARDEGMNQASWALSYLISGVLFWGGVGWLADYLLHLRFLVGIGIVLGAGLGCYRIVKRFGQQHESPRPQSSGQDQGRGTRTTDDPDTKGMTER